MRHFERLVFTFLCLLLTNVGVAQFVEEKKIDTTGINRDVENQQMLIKILDASSKKNFRADVVLKGMNPRKPIILPQVQDTILFIKNYRRYTVSVVTQGYMYFAHKFWPDEADTHNETIELAPLEVGLKTTVEDIIFPGDEITLHPKSNFALDELVSFMKKNPNVKIKIIGHANGPKDQKGTRSAGFYRKVTEQRAQSVRDYLIRKGIQADRLATEGKGNSEMLYANPSTDWQTQMNRRIEIEVIGL
jgi:outer membrane protein OmpA-like peptidoglycan-associated protein